MIYCDICGV